MSRSPSDANSPGQTEPQLELVVEPKDDPEANEDDDSGWVNTQQSAPVSPTSVSGTASANPDLGVGLAAWVAEVRDRLVNFRPWHFD